MTVNINFKNITVTTASDNAGIFIGKDNAPIGWDILSKSNTAASTGNNTNSLNHSLFIVNDCDGTDAKFVNREWDGFTSQGDPDGDGDHHNIVKRYKNTLDPNSTDPDDDSREGKDDDSVDSESRDKYAEDPDNTGDQDLEDDWNDVEFEYDHSGAEDDDDKVYIQQNGKNVFPLSGINQNKKDQNGENQADLHSPLRVKRLGSPNFHRS